MTGCATRSMMMRADLTNSRRCGRSDDHDALQPGASPFRPNSPCIVAPRNRAPLRPAKDRRTLTSIHSSCRGDPKPMSGFLIEFVRAARASAVAAALMLPLASHACAGARPGQHRRRRRKGDRRGRQHFDLADGRSARRPRRSCRPARRSRSSSRSSSRTGAGRAGSDNQNREPHAAPRQLARLRLHHRCRPASSSPTTT